MLSSQDQRGQISLFKFCEQFFVEAITKTMFGNLIYDLEPDLTEHLLNFNDDVWMLIFHYPRFAAKRLYHAQQKIITALESYMRYPKESRFGESWLIESVISQQVVAGVDEQNRAKMLLMIYWAYAIIFSSRAAVTKFLNRAVSNAYKMAFWVIAYILADTSLQSAVQAETSQAFIDGTLDTRILLETSPVLDSVYNETLRLVNGAISARKVIAPTEIGGKILSKGNSILIPYRQLHFNTDVFDHDADSFNPGRFLGNKGLLRNPNFRPYGGGVTYCPGRVLAAMEIYGFVALFLRRFKVENEASVFSPFPQLEDCVPALGITGPKKGMDVSVTLCKSSS